VSAITRYARAFAEIILKKQLNRSRTAEELAVVAGLTKNSSDQRTSPANN